MYFSEIKAFVMHQTNNDSDDLGDFAPYLNGYINEGYEELVQAYAGEATHVLSTSTTYPPLRNDSDVPAIPEWAHLALAHYATYCIYGNGTQQKQNRGYPFLAKYKEVLSKIRHAGGSAGIATPITTFSNIPT